MFWSTTMSQFAWSTRRQYSKERFPWFYFLQIKTNLFWSPTPKLRTKLPWSQFEWLSIDLLSILPMLFIFVQFPFALLRSSIQMFFVKRIFLQFIIQKWMRKFLKHFHQSCWSFLSFVSFRFLKFQRFLVLAWLKSYQIKSFNISRSSSVIVQRISFKRNSLIFCSIISCGSGCGILCKTLIVFFSCV